MKPVLAVISGGGCRQIEVATGMLMALDEQGVKIDEYYGCSAGSIVSGLAASGLSGKAISALIKLKDIDDLLDPDYLEQVKNFIPFTTIDHLYDASGALSFLETHMTPEAKNKCLVAVTRLRDNEPFMVKATPKTVLASMAIPEVISPVMIGSELFVDGGVRRLTPLPKIADFDKYSRIYIMFCNDPIKDWKPLTRMGRGIKAFYSTSSREYIALKSLHLEERYPVTILEIPPSDGGLLDWSKDNMLINFSYEHTVELLNK